jgi:hypothetical protein
MRDSVKQAKTRQETGRAENRLGVAPRAAKPQQHLARQESPYCATINLRKAHEASMVEDPAVLGWSWGFIREPNVVT